jgi:hypothetical protein
MLYRGEGTTHSYPHSPLTDGLLSSALAAAGHLGSRAPGACTWGSTSIEQASEYTRGGTADGLLVLEPLEGAVVSWSPGRTDLLLDFQSYLNELRWDWEGTAPSWMPRGARALVRDIAGDVGIVDTYLHLGRQGKNLAAVAKAFVSTIEVRESRIGAGDDLMDLLDGHVGEVWITGPHRTEALSAAPIP